MPLTYAQVLKKNPYHDEKGRFTFASNASHGSVDNMMTNPVSKRDSMAAHTDTHGNWTPARAALHQEIVAKALQGKQRPLEKPVVTFMGGGPASGKSELTKKNPTENQVVIDPDDIKQQLPEWSAETAAAEAQKRNVNDRLASYVHEESSYVAGLIRRESIKRGLNTLVDGTGDSTIEKITRKVEEFRQAGYDVHANYVTLDVDTAYQRMLNRGKKTGRYVPRAFMEEVHVSVSQVVPIAMERGVFDTISVWDTSNGTTHVASARGGNLTIHDQRLWERFLAKGKR